MPPNREFSDSTDTSTYLRFDVSSERFKRRTSLVNAALQRFSLVGATGSFLEAHLITRLGLAGGVPNLIGCGTSKEEVLDLCARTENVLLLITESVAGDLGYDLVETLRERLKGRVRIVFILQDRSLAKRISDFNLDAVVLATSFGSGSLIKALVRNAFGKRYFDPDFLRATQETACPVLTKRELQVLQLLDQGLSNKDIASELFISAVTVRDYVVNLMRKLEAINRTQVVSNAKNLGLL